MPPEEYENFNVAEAVQSIGNDLFGGETDPIEAAPGESASGTAPNAVDNASAPTDSSPPNSTIEPIDPLPKSWKKEMENDWKTLPKTVRDYVYKRESDVLAGIQQYHSGHQSYSTLVEPFKEVFQQNPDVQPVQLFQNLMHSHVKLLTLPADQKQQFGRELLKAYGIDLEGQVTQNQSLPPEFSRMQQELAETRRILRENQENAYRAEVARYEKEVQDFAKNPKNQYFPEVQNDILKLLSTGAAADLKSAYETAIWANPAVREKLLLAKQQEEAAKTKAKPTNIESSGSVRVNGSKPLSIDQTIEATAQKLFAKH